MSADALGGGFASPPHEAARAFRALLDVMARPGRVARLEGAAPPAPLPAAAGALALTLCDADATVWLAPALRTEAVEDWLRFHCGAAPVTDRAAAAFAFGAPEALAPADAFAAGDPEYPDRSCTLVVLIGAFAGAEAVLSGPGIRHEARLPLGPDRAGAMALAAAHRGAFPLGRDLFLVAGDRVAALPRTTRITEG